MQTTIKPFLAHVSNKHTVVKYRLQYYDIFLGDQALVFDTKEQAIQHSIAIQPRIAQSADDYENKVLSAFSDEWEIDEGEENEDAN